MLTPKLYEENLFDDWFDDFGFGRELDHLGRKLYGKHAGKVMLTDVREHDDHYEVEIDLPGFKKEDLNIELSEGYLTITANKGHEQEEKNKEGKIVRQERYSGTMSRSFYVGEEVTGAEIGAKFEDGVLKLNVPKKEVKKVDENHRIAIE